MMSTGKSCTNGCEASCYARSLKWDEEKVFRGADCEFVAADGGGDGEWKDDAASLARKSGRRSTPTGVMTAGQGLVYMEPFNWSSGTNGQLFRIIAGKFCCKIALLRF